MLLHTNEYLVLPNEYLVLPNEYLVKIGFYGRFYMGALLSTSSETFAKPLDINKMVIWLQISAKQFDFGTPKKPDTIT
jgi:hypothetical protein